MKILGVCKNFNIPNYSVNVIRKSMKININIIKLTLHFAGVDKADVEKSFGNLNFSKVVTFKKHSNKSLKVISDIYSSLQSLS